MRRITQEEFDQFCSSNSMSTLENCIIGKEIEYPKEIRFARFRNCTFEKSFCDVDLYHVIFNRMDFLNVFRNCKFYKVNFEQCSVAHCMFEDCTFNAVVFILCFVRHITLDGIMDNVMFRLCDLRSSGFFVRASCVQFDQCDMIACYASDNCISFPQSAPSEGSFIAWKKALMLKNDGDHEVLVKLRIPDDAERCSANHKCRADKVEVIQYETLDGEKLPDNIDVHSFFNSAFVYHIGMIDSGEYDHDPQCECSEGIHFFLNRDDAVNYVF
jgi:hypothetical protein